jgi:eukaryotic-like serine/threonine-protein kinase
MTPGALIGKKYRLSRPIGEGAMGVVWAAVNEDTLGEVALKLILRSNEELRQRLRREARAAGKLRHPNIIEIYDIGETVDGDPFLVMPLLTGETLSELLERQRRLEPQIASRIARDVARALAGAHAGQVIHRDLKPANIFLHQELHTDAPIVKVLDFGVSKNLAATDGLNTVAGGAVGSPAYMSPEQARADRTLDHRADLWSLGVVLFEMLTGVRPFKGDANQIIPQIVMGEVPPVARFVRHVDPALCALVARCLERDRDKRIGSAAELATALDRFVNPAPIAAPAARSSVIPARSAPDLADLEATAALTSSGARISAPGPAPVAHLAPPNARPEFVDPSTRSPRFDAVSSLSGSSLLEFAEDDDEDDLEQTTRMDSAKMTALLMARTPAPSAPPIEAMAPPQPMYAATTPISGFGQGVAPAPRPGSVPSFNALPHDTALLGAAAPVIWPPQPPSQPAFGPSGGAPAGSANWPVTMDGTVLMPQNVVHQIPGPRFGSPPSPGSSTAPLIQTPTLDPALSIAAPLRAELRARQRKTLLIAAGVGIPAFFLLVLGLYRSLSSTPTATPELSAAPVSPAAPAPSVDPTVSADAPAPRDAGTEAPGASTKLPAPTKPLLAPPRPLGSPVGTSRPLLTPGPRPTSAPTGQQTPRGGKPPEKLPAWLKNAYVPSGK